MPPSRLVYRTDRGSVCPKCGWPVERCACAKSQQEAVPDRVTAKLRLEKAGRGGKEVTVIDGLPRNPAYLDELARALKKACGTGGTVREGASGSIELQGDRRERAAQLLAARGLVVKGWPA